MFFVFNDIVSGHIHNVSTMFNVTQILSSQHALYQKKSKN